MGFSKVKIKIWHSKKGQTLVSTQHAHFAFEPTVNIFTMGQSRI